MIIRDKIYINTSELGYRVNDLCMLFTYRNPLIFQRKKLKLSIKNIPTHLRHYKLDSIDGRMVVQIPRGGLQRVREFYNNAKIPMRVMDQRISHPQIDVYLKGTDLEPQQLQTIELLEKNSGGLIEMSPGGGKTISILGLIATVKQPTLILVHELRLSDQWISEIEERLGGSFKLGKYDGYVKKDGDVVVAIINSAYNKNQEDPTFFHKFGMVVIDETHHIPADMFMSVVNNLPSKYRIGVTGTVKRKDQKELLTYDVLGPILLKIDAQDLKHRITDFDYTIINTNIRMEIPTRKRWTGKKRENVIDMTTLLTKLVENNDRNDLIIGEAVRCIEEGYFPLILSDRVAHNELLYERLQTMGYKVVLLIGKTRKSTSWDDIREDETIQCIIANTKIASEGLDLPRLSALLLTCPSTNNPKIKQQIGRIRRVYKDKKMPLVVDFCDNLAYTDVEDGSKKYLLRYITNKRIRFYNELKAEYNG